MKLGPVAQNPIEAVALLSGLVPTPLGDTIVAMMLARTIMVACKLDVFEALADQPLPSADVAQTCGLSEHGTQALLFALEGAGFVRRVGQAYTLTRTSRKWLLKSSPDSLYDYMLFSFLNWQWIDRCEAFVRSGKPIRVHEEMSDEEWGIYQRGMRSLASFSAREVARRVSVPASARAMLDIGGAHGYYSVALCRRHPALRSTILELPQAITHSAPLLAKEDMGDRVVYQEGNALTDDLGVEAYDLVFIGDVLHHFDAATNCDLVRRAALALRPGGYLVVEELIRPRTARDAGEIGALSALYFALTSRAGTYSFEELAAWQRDAGLAPRRPVRLLTAPGAGLQSARKPLTLAPSEAPAAAAIAVPAQSAIQG